MLRMCKDARFFLPRHHGIQRKKDVFRLLCLGLASRFTWIFFLSIAVLYNEWFCYRICYDLWWSREQMLRPGDPEKSMTVLLVSDPQIQGYRDEHPVLGIITRWDADRYLTNGYYYALAYSNPDLVVFLGDLMDEGSRATSESEYKGYVNRFRRIFLDRTPQEKLILPGDNDVGGEGFDIRTIDKVLRFEKHFSRTYQLVSKRFVDFFMLDYTRNDIFTSSRLERAKSQMREMQRNRLKQFSVFLNHENILPTDHGFFTPVFEASRPNLLVTGHSHRSFLMRCLRCWDRNGGVLEYMQNPETKVDFSQFTLSTADVEGVVEIGVPTCSYRMGVQDMAYGLLTLRANGVVQYRNLWLPSRFLCLGLYVVALIAAAASYFAYLFRTRRLMRLRLLK